MSTQAGKLSLTSIVAVGLDGAIGIRNELPWRLRSDLRFFKKTTRDNIIIMGRRTFDSIGGCLPERENIVLSHRPRLFEEHPGCTHSHSVEEALYVRTKHKKKSAYIIGGALTYQQFAPFVDRYLITVVKSQFPSADAFFDQSILGEGKLWDRHEIQVERVETPNADEFDFSVFELNHKRIEDVIERRATMIDGFSKKNHFVARRKLFKEVTNGKSLGEAIALA